MPDTIRVYVSVNRLTSPALWKELNQASSGTRSALLRRYAENGLGGIQGFAGAVTSLALPEAQPQIAPPQESEPAAPAKSAISDLKGRISSSF